MQSMPLLSVRGKPEPMQTYLVLRAKPRALAVQLRGVEGVETEMIGREAELKRLQIALQTVMEDRQLHVLTIVGEAGIGKSRLLREFQKWAELLPQNVRWFSGRAAAEMAGLPFSLVFRAEPGKEDVLLRIASAYEAASQRRVPPPNFGPL